MKRANELSDEELQVVIAEDQGYHPHPDNHTKDQKWWSYGGEGYGLPNGVPKKICVMPPLNDGMWPDIEPLPNYPGDLNAMHDAEQSLSSVSYKYRWGNVAYRSNEYSDYHQLITYGNVPCYLTDGCGKHDDTPNAPEQLRYLAGGITATARQRAEAYVIVRKLALP